MPLFGLVQADVGLAEDRTAAFATEVPTASGARVADAADYEPYPFGRRFPKIFLTR